MRGSGMDIETLLLRNALMGGDGLLGGVDWLTVLTLLMVGLVYFLAPVFGYGMGKRGLFVASLWVLIGKMGLALLRVCMVAMEIIDRGQMSNSGGSGTNMMQMLFVLLNVFETGLFVLGIVLFVIGLTALRRDMDLPRGRARDFPDE
jgi:hypothetical protein